MTTAISGWLSLTGDPNRAPLATGFPQSYLTAGADAAIGTLVTLFHRERTGEGQHVDVSAQAGLVS